MALEGLEGLIKGLESQESWQVQKQFRLVLLYWPKSVGFAVARKTRPIGIQRDTLYVATCTAAWAQTLTYERLNILRKLNRYQPKALKTIRFSTAQWNQSGGADGADKSSGDDPINTAQSKPPSRFINHPSYVGEVPTIPPSKDTQLTPQIAFQRWAATLQNMQLTQALCPVCRCSCPQGELNRWGRCALCATKRWQ